MFLWFEEKVQLQKDTLFNISATGNYSSSKKPLLKYLVMYFCIVTLSICSIFSFDSCPQKKWVECPLSTVFLLNYIFHWTFLPVLMPSIKSSKRIRKSDFTICKRRITTALSRQSPSSMALFIFKPQKTEQSSFCTTIQTSVSLKCAKDSPCRNTGSYSPCSHFATNSTGELPSRSNHRHWERFHTTLDILRHGRIRAQPQSQHYHTMSS